MKSCLPIILILLIGTLSNDTSAEDRLDKIARSLEEGSSIEHVDANDIAERIKHGKPVLFDVRTENEFAVSHLTDAIRLDPDTDPEDFLRDYGTLLGKNQVIFYCSTGRRSTELAEQVTERLHGVSAGPVNMRGGIFRWHNEARTLQNAAGETDKIHPYNWYWKRLLKRKDLVRYSPQPASEE